MKTRGQWLGTWLLWTGAAVALAGTLAGCDAYFFMGDDPVWRSEICEDGTFDCFTPSTTTGSGCEGDPTQDASLVSNECGVFVKAGATGGDGTKELPFGSFVEASKSTASWVFACSGDYAETEGVVFEGDIAVYGGFTGCEAEWTWSPEARAKITGPADAIAVTLGGGTAYVENVDVTAANAVSDGGSSIAVLVKDGAVVEIKNGDLTSGDAKAGVAGESLGDDGALNGAKGADGAGACTAGDHPALTGEVKSCTSGENSTAGNGGAGGPLGGGGMGTSGTDGDPLDDAFPTFGQGGDGEGQNGSPVCISGTDGAPGGDGSPALPASGMGDITEIGYQGVDGNLGEYGKPGQGGGGGGGSKGATAVQCDLMSVNVFGASGGAGGTGGCGGKGGGGGGAGGASIALLSLNADVTLTDVTLRAGSGGNGGVGGNGQAGGQKGSGGAFGAGSGMAKASCQGGAGGAGGFGGPGGGGTGGPAIGIAYTNTAPNGGTVVMDTAVPGIGGDGGSGNEAAGKGADGLPCKTIDFEKGASSCE